MSKSIKNILRWIAVLPASVASVMFVSFISKTVIPYNYYTGQTTILAQILAIVIESALEGAAFVIVGYCVAPTHRPTIRIVLATILIVFLVISGIISIHLYLPENIWNFVTQILLILFTGIGAIASSLYLKKEENEGYLIRENED